MKIILVGAVSIITIIVSILFYSQFTIENRFLNLSYRLEKEYGLNIVEKYIEVGLGSGSYCLFSYKIERYLTDIEEVNIKLLENNYVGVYLEQVDIKNRDTIIAVTTMNCEYYFGKYLVR